MAIKSDGKDKSMFYIKMKESTNYDARWSMGIIEKYDVSEIKRPEDHVYSQRKAIIKSHRVEYVKDDDK